MVATRSPGETGESVDVGAELIAGTEDKAFLGSAAQEQGETALGPVVAACLAVDTRGARPSRP